MSNRIRENIKFAKGDGDLDRVIELQDELIVWLDVEVERQEKWIGTAQEILDGVCAQLEESEEILDTVRDECKESIAMIKKLMP